MIPSQKKKIYEVISEQELDWTNFSEENIDIVNETDVIRLLHKPTNFYFQFSYNINYEHLPVGPWSIEHTPGSSYKPQDFHVGFIKSFEQVIDKFKNWLQLLKKEIEIKSSLDSILNYNINLKDFDNKLIRYDESFTIQEKDMIKNLLTNFKEDINKPEFLEIEIGEINNKIDYLIDRLEKNLSKIDWTNIFISTIISILISEGLQIVKSTIFLEYVKSLFHFITGGQFLN